jgi:hypothetical protein
MQSLSQFQPRSQSSFTHSRMPQHYFNYRSVVGKLNHLARTTRPDILTRLPNFQLTQGSLTGMPSSTWFATSRKTRDLEIRFTPDLEKGFECYCNTNFSGTWTVSIADVDPSTLKSHSRWFIFYAGCPIIWALKLQTQTALTTTEAEYIAMSMSLRDVILIMELVKEMKEHDIPVICSKPYVYCKVLEDTQELLILPGFQSFALALSTSTCVAIIFMIMSIKDLSRSSQLVYLTRLLTY